MWPRKQIDIDSGVLALRYPRRVGARRWSTRRVNSEKYPTLWTDAVTRTELTGACPDSNMTDITSQYRWNTSAAAEAYDQAAPIIHPLYETIQNQILSHLPFATDETFLLVDLGGGSGRLVERLLGQFPRSRAVIIDQSQPFLALAERRLRQFATRATLVERRLQDAWDAELPVAPQAIVSMSAIHHLDLPEKQSLFARCHATLDKGGIFLNGDEFRPADDDQYLDLLRDWSAHMYAAIDDGRIPAHFRKTLDYWHDRNINRLGAPKTSGDDCHETVTLQTRYLDDAGFTQIEISWHMKLWAVLMGRKPSR